MEETRTEAAGTRSSEGSLTEQDSATLGRLIAAVDAGQPWYPALLDAIGQWHCTEEEVRGRRFRYLVGGEAFDYLLLAERLLLELGDRVAPGEREALLFFGRPPAPMDDAEFHERVGETKYRAHLNHIYGVVVEQALLLAAEQDVQKEKVGIVGGGRDGSQEAAFQRVYGKPRAELLEQFQADRGLERAERLDHDELMELTYWLFKYRLRAMDRARVASDTRRALVCLQRIEEAARRRSAHATEAPSEDELVIEAVLLDAERVTR